MRSPFVIALVGLTALLAPAVAPASDPRFDEQWALQADGGLDAPAAWRIADGTGTVVAVLDTGADLTHPELRDTLWTNPAEIAGNGRDDDGDGYVDDVHGADVVNGDGHPADDEGHGTHIAGAIVARRDGVGVAGIAPGARLMAVKVLDSRRGGSTSTLARGIAYAVRHGATVINTSINGDVSTPELEQAVALATAAGIPIVASSGNQARSLDSQPSYPAAYAGPGTIAVASSGLLGGLSPFSNFGRGTVEVAAPGEQILSTKLGGGHELRSGTSMAAPWAAGTLALLRGARPDLGLDGLRDALVAGAAPGDGLAALLGGGGLRPAVSLRRALGLPDERAVRTARADVAPTLTARVKRRSKSRTRALVTWSLRGGAVAVTAFRVSAPGGRTLARTRGARRGTWVTGRKGRRVKVQALGARRQVVATATIRL